MESDADRAVLEAFVAQTREGMVARGWEADPGATAAADSIFLGVFRRLIDPDWLATVEFIRESGSIDGFELRLTGPRRVHSFSVTVGGEFGLLHVPTERLLHDLGVACEANVMRDLEDIFDDEGSERPVISDAASADAAARMLLGAVDTYALPFAHENASIDAVIAFITTGGQTNRDPEFEYLFVPTLLASGGRHQEARAALDEYRQRSKTTPANEEEFKRFADGLSACLDGRSD